MSEKAKVKSEKKTPLSRGDRQWSVQRNCQGCVDGRTSGVRTHSRLHAPSEHTPHSTNHPPAGGFCIRFSPLGRGFIGTLLIFLILVIPTFAQDKSPIKRPGELRILESYFQIAIEQNPELASLKKNVEAQRQRAPQVRSLPDPEVSIGFYLNPDMEADLASRFSAGVMQMFPWFGTLDTRGNVEESISEAMNHSLTARQLNILREIQDLWFEYFRLNHHVHVNMDILNIVRDLQSLLEARYESGRAGQSDLLRLQMEEQRILNTIDKLEDEKNPRREEFNALLNREPGDEIEVPARLPERMAAWSKDELFEFAQNRHPGFSRLEAQRNQYRNEAELARLEGRPSFGLGLEYTGSDFGMMSMMDLDPIFAGMATIRIPIYRGKYRAQKKEAQLQIQATDHLETDLTNRLHSDIEKAMKRLRDGQREYLLISEELLPRSEQVLELLSEEYGTGQVRFDELLQVLRELLALENEKVEALAEQNKAMAEIEQLIANELQVID
ncbi:TolC family protein [Rhodohalobacter sp. 8-1]|uniref:TolC family protein n=1 Tax=Rhodohalobacter sp. 8-1 TaxID=3131972 RepID=UPI0030EF2EC2